MYKSQVLESLIVAIGLVGMGFLVSGGLAKVGHKPRTVQVKGLAEKEVAANKVTWPLVVKYFDNDVNSLYQKVKDTNSKVTAYLKENGIKAEEITLQAPNITDRRANMYDYSNNNYNAPRYFVTSVITVTSTNVQAVQKIIDNQGELLAIGIVPSSDEYQYNVSYEYTDLNKIKPGMIEEATKNARQAAEKFAKDSESTLGYIQEAYQGQFSIENRDSNTPYIKKVRVVTNVTYTLD